MVTAPPIQRVPGRPRQRRLAERRERRRLVQVVPETREALREPLGVQPAPPRAHPRVREVGVHRLAGPRHALHQLSGAVPHERVLGEPAVVHRVAGRRPDRRVHDRHQVDPVPPQLVRQHRQLREAVPVDGEHLVLVVVVDVQVDGVQRQPALLVPGDDPPHLLLAAEPPARVLVPQRPRRRHRRRPRQRGPHQQHARGSTHHDPGAQRTARHAQLAAPGPVVPGPGPLLALAQHDRPVPGVVVEHQVRARVGHHQLHRHGEVQRIVVRPEGTPGIGVPQAVRPIPQPRPRGPPAQPEEPRVRSHLGPQHPAPRPPGRRLPPARRQVTPQPHPARRAHVDRAVARHGDRDPLGHDPPAAVLVGLQHRPRIGLGAAAGQRVRRLRSGPVPAEEHRAVHRDQHPQPRTAEVDDTAPGTRLDVPHGPGHPRARHHASAAPRRPHAACARRPARSAPPGPPPRNRPTSPNAPGHDRPCCSPCHSPPHARVAFNFRSPVPWPHLDDTDYVGRALVRKSITWHRPCQPRHAHTPHVRG